MSRTNDAVEPKPKQYRGCTKPRSANHGHTLFIAISKCDEILNCAGSALHKSKTRPLQYRERSHRMPHSIFRCDSPVALLSVASGGFARGTVMVAAFCRHSCS